jgi:plastocyanin
MLNRVCLSFLIAASAIACGGSNDSGATAPRPAAAPAQKGVAIRQVPAGAVVVLDPATPREFPAPGGPAVMDQYSKQFIPAVLLARVGQPVEFRNTEDEVHNVRVDRLPTGTSIFNISRPMGQTYIHTFDQPGLYDVNCDIHPGMKATLIVSSGPFAAIAAAGDGTVRFADVPAGPYKLTIYGAGSNQERMVEITSPDMEIKAGS